MQRFPSSLARRTPLSALERYRASVTPRVSRTVSTVELAGNSTHGATVQRPADISEKEWETFGRNKKYRVSHATRIDTTGYGMEAPRPCARCAGKGLRCMVYTMEGQTLSQSPACSSCRLAAKPCSLSTSETVKWYRKETAKLRKQSRRAASDKIREQEDKNRSLLADVGRLRMEQDAVAAMKKEHRGLLEEIRALKAKAAATAKDEDRKKKLMAKIAQVPGGKESEALEETLNDAQRTQMEVSNLRRRNARLESAKERVRRLKGRLVELRQENARVQAVWDEGRQLQREKEILQRQGLELRRMVEDMPQQGAAKEAAAQDVKGLEREHTQHDYADGEDDGDVAQLRREIRSLQQDNARLRAASEIRREDSLSAQDAAQKAQKEISQLQVSLEETQRSERELEWTVEKLQREIPLLQHPPDDNKSQDTAVATTQPPSQRGRGRPLGATGEATAVTLKQDLEGEFGNLKKARKEFDRLKGVDERYEALKAELDNVRADHEKTAEVGKMRGLEAETGRLRFVIESLRGVVAENEELRQEVFDLGKAREREERAKARQPEEKG